MGPWRPGHTGGCRPGQPSRPVQDVSAGRPRGCVGVLEGIMNSAVATAFLPKFVGFPSLRGLHSSTVQLRRAPLRGGVRRCGATRAGSRSRSLSGIPAARSKAPCDTCSCRSHARIHLCARLVARQTHNLAGTHAISPDMRSTDPPYGNARPATERGARPGADPAFGGCGFPVGRRPVSCLRRRIHLHRPRRRTTRLRRSFPRGGCHRRNRSLPRRPTSCCCCRPCRRTPTPGAAHSPRSRANRPCVPGTPAPPRKALRSPPG